jgi:methyl-accepting chemotaxis protein
LPTRSQGASREISEFSGRSVAVADQAGKIILAVVPDIQRATEVVQEISAASREQSTGVDQISKAIVQLDSVSQQNAAASLELNGQAEQLADTLAWFKLPDPERSSERALALR